MANLGPAPKAQFFTAAGQPLVGGKVYTYAAGTTTPLATYTSSSASSANPNPIILDGRGECNIWFSPASAYKIKLTDSNDVEIYVVDNITSAGYVSGGSIINSSIVNGTMSGSALSGVTIANSSINSSSINSSSINNTVIGATTPTTATFTTFSGSWASLPAGTRMLFVQTAAPTGWVKSTTDNNKALRIVSGTAGTGGSVAFTTAFASQAITGTVDGHVLTEAQIPSHTHSYTAGGGVIGVAAGTSYNVLWSPGGATTGATGGANAHTHGLTAAAINLAVQYVDAIIAVKD
jgi:hypothetical protein